MAGNFPGHAWLGEGLDGDERWWRGDGTEDGGVGNIGGIATGTQADKAHGDGRAGRVEEIPAAREVDLDVGMEVGGAQRWVRPIVDAAGKARGDAQGAADGDHQVGKITADADAVDQRVDGRGGRAAGVAAKGDLLIHPVTDGFNAPVAFGQLAELLDGQPAEAVGLAVAAGVDVAEYRKRQGGDRGFSDQVGVADVMFDVYRRLVGNVQRAGLSAEAQVTGAGIGGELDAGRDGLADLQGFTDQRLAGGLRCLDIENEISAGKFDLIVQVDGELKANHGFPWGETVTGAARRGNGKAR